MELVEFIVKKLIDSVGSCPKGCKHLGYCEKAELICFKMIKIILSDAGQKEVKHGS